MYSVQYYITMDDVPVNYIDNAWDKPECCQCTIQDVDTAHWADIQARINQLRKWYVNNNINAIAKVVKHVR
jgi:hypothetical protein